jgi:hypothetical protein
MDVIEHTLHISICHKPANVNSQYPYLEPSLRMRKRVLNTFMVFILKNNLVLVIVVRGNLDISLSEIYFIHEIHLVMCRIRLSEGISNYQQLKKKYTSTALNTVLASAHIHMT